MDLASCAVVVLRMTTKARIELDAGTRTFASGLLPELIAALRRCRPGDLLAVISSEAGIGADLEAWCRFTHNTLIETTVEAARTRWVFRCGEAPRMPTPAGPSARACGSTRISTATCVATIAACAPPPRRRGGRSASSVCSGSPAKPPEPASAKSS